jgi:hypothetical protein
LLLVHSLVLPIFRQSNFFSNLNPSSR